MAYKLEKTKQNKDSYALFLKKLELAKERVAKIEAGKKFKDVYYKQPKSALDHDKGTIEESVKYMDVEWLIDGKPEDKIIEMTQEEYSNLIMNKDSKPVTKKTTKKDTKK